MRICVVQKRASNRDYLSYIERASASGPDLVCLGELATTGCLYARRRVPALKEVVAGLPADIPAILLGLPLEEKTGLFNACLYRHRGVSQIYRKVNLFGPFGEPEVYEPGSSPGLLNTEFGQLGVAICYDLRFDELFRALVSGGAWAVFVPAAFPRVRIADWRNLLVKRAVDHRLFTVGINCVGCDERHEFGGSSMVVDPSGQVLAQADEEREQFLTAELIREDRGLGPDFGDSASGPVEGGASGADN